MKRQYHRPELLVERFDLTQTLSNCSVMIGLQDQRCILKDEDSTNQMKNYAVKGYFSADPYIGCGKPITNMDHEDGICYHTSVNLVFSS